MDKNNKLIRVVKEEEDPSYFNKSMKDRIMNYNASIDSLPETQKKAVMNNENISSEKLKMARENNPKTSFENLAKKLK